MCSNHTNNSEQDGINGPAIDKSKRNNIKGPAKAKSEKQNKVSRSEKNPANTVKPRHELINNSEDNKSVISVNTVRINSDPKDSKNSYEAMGKREEPLDTKSIEQIIFLFL